MRLVKHLYLMILVVGCGTLTAQQTPKAQIHKRYIVKDTSALHKDAMLVLYTDNTYLNFGIYANKADDDSYIWYSCGTWLNTDSTLTLRTKFDLFDMDYLLKGIKFYYKRRKDHVLIDSYYEFVKELFKEKNLNIHKDTLTDPKKTISYSEINI